MDFFICSLTCVDRMVHERQEPTLFQAVNLNIKPCANEGNIVECYMLRPFAHPVACCCELVGVVASISTPLPKRTQQRQFKDRQLNSMTFQAWKMKFFNSMTFQVFHDLYEPCYYRPNIAASSLRSTHGARSRRLYLPSPPYNSRVFTLQLCSRNGYSVVWNFCGIKFAPSTWVLNPNSRRFVFR